VAADSPGAAEREEVRYHLVGDLDLDQPSTAAGFAERARPVIDDLVARGEVPIVSGGTGLYLRAALTDVAFPSAPDPGRREWAEEAVTVDLEAAVDELRRLAPALAERVDTANPRRVARALEAAVAPPRTEEAPGIWHQADRHTTLRVAVTRPRAVLDELIAVRVRRELAAGLVEELERALERPGTCREARQIIGMREVAAVAAGTLPREELEARLVARTRRLARKQLTWLRRVRLDAEIDLGDRPPEAAVEELAALWLGR
jgi:tRNA dimethylallyltransferase